MDTRPNSRREVLRALTAGGIAAAVLTVSQPAAVSAGEISLDKVPAAIKEVAERLVKGAKWSSALKLKDEGHEFYELLGEDAKGHGLTIEITLDGKVMSVERQIDVKDVPKAATEAIAARMPAFKAETVLAVHQGEEIHSLHKADLTYQLNGTAAKGKDVTVEVTAEGKITEVKREIDLLEVPATVADVLAQKAPRFHADIVHKVTRGNTVAGFLFAAKKGWVAFVSADGKEFEIHKDE